MLFTYPIAPFFVPSTEKPHSGTPRFSLDAMTWIRKKTCCLLNFLPKLLQEIQSENYKLLDWTIIQLRGSLNLLQNCINLLISELFHLSVQLNHEYLQIKSPWTYQSYFPSFFNQINSKLVNDFISTFTTFIVDLWSSCLNQQNDQIDLYNSKKIERAHFHSEPKHGSQTLIFH